MSLAAPSPTTASHGADHQPRIDRDALEALPRDVALQHEVVPIKVSSDTLTVLTSEPRNLRKLAALETIAGRRVTPRHASREEIAALLQQHYPEHDKGLRVEEQAQAEAQQEPGEAGDEVDSAAVHNTNILIAKALEQRASDIHLETGEGEVIVRYRIDGRLIEHAKLPAHMARSLVARVKVLAGMDIAERRLPQDGRIAFRWDGKNADLRVSTSPTIHGERVVMRVLQKARALVDVEHLEFSERNLEAFQNLIHKPYGMFLITGPTGSGKSYTLFSVLRRLAQPGVNIMTIEDPVEYELPGINQAQLNERAGFTFARALRAYLRQDPDIIMVGEIRDTDTARIATEAALTGHLLLATLHTNDAPSAPGRLVKMGVESYNLAASLLGVLAQRLVRRVCPHCATSQAPNPQTLKRLGLELDESARLKAGRGCPKCNGTGYRGRLAIHELMSITPAIEDAIGENATAHELRELALESGMTTLRQDGVQKALAGLTTLEEVLATTLE